MNEDVESLVGFCRDRAEGNLRTVAEYRPDESRLDVAYVRDDIRARYTGTEYERLVEKLYGTHDAVVEVGDADAAIGEGFASVHYFEHGFVIQLVVDEEYGYLVTFDSVVGSSLASFVDECLGAVGERTTLAD